MKKLIVLLFLFPVVVMGQKEDEDLGVRFERNITAQKWKLIARKAKKESKYILVIFNYENIKSRTNYFYQYFKPIFTDTAISNFFNSNFINICIEYDYKKNANHEANAVAKKLTNSFNIKIYPSFLFFDSEENLVHKFTSWQYPKSDFFAQAKLAFDKNLRYYSLIKRFETGDRDTCFFGSLFKATQLANDSTDKYVFEFIKSRDNLFTKENAEILMHSNSHKVAFDYLYSNQKIWSKIIDADTLEKFYNTEIRKQVQETYYYVYSFNIKVDTLIQMFDELYPKYGRKASIDFLLHQKYNYNNINKLNDHSYIVKTYLDSNFISKSTSADLNSYAWVTFQNITDTTLLNKALSWSKKSLEQDKDNPMYLDTYANILYKLGQTKEAITIETKALELVDAKDKKSYQETLNKMKQGEKTW